VVVAPQGVTGHVGQIGLAEHVGRRRGFPGQVIHAYRHDSQSAGVEEGGTAALEPVAGHIRHLPVAARIQPGQQPRLVLAEVRIRDTRLLEAELQGPRLDVPGQRRHIHGICRLERHRGA
jgi:hypothetical protein